LKLDSYNFDEILNEKCTYYRERYVFMELTSGGLSGLTGTAAGIGQSNPPAESPVSSSGPGPNGAGGGGQGAADTGAFRAKAAETGSISVVRGGEPAPAEVQMPAYVARAQPELHKETLARFYLQAVNDRLRAETILTQLAKQQAGGGPTILLKPTSPIEEYRAGSGAGGPP
jgi:hypothetical protein